MSTRANVIVFDGLNAEIIYRHYDGYPEGTGADLKRWLKNTDIKDLNAKEIADSIISDKATMYVDFQGKERSPYELTDCIHGDVEYIYIVIKRQGVKADGTIECVPIYFSTSVRHQLLKHIIGDYYLTEAIIKYL